MTDPASTSLEERLSTALGKAPIPEPPPGLAGQAVSAAHRARARRRLVRGALTLAAASVVTAGALGVHGRMDSKEVVPAETYAEAQWVPGANRQAGLEVRVDGGTAWLSRFVFDVRHQDGVAQLAADRVVKGGTCRSAPPLDPPQRLLAIGSGPQVAEIPTRYCEAAPEQSYRDGSLIVGYLPGGSTAAVVHLRDGRSVRASLSRIPADSGLPTSTTGDLVFAVHVEGDVQPQPDSSPEADRTQSGALAPGHVLREVTATDPSGLPIRIRGKDG